MDERIKVYVFRRRGRRYYQAEWRDPVTGKQKTRSTGTAVERDAERFAGTLEKELNEGSYRPPSKTTWEEFRDRYEAEVLEALAKGTRKKARAALNAVERIINPLRLVALNADQLSRLQMALRDEGLAEPTIKGHLGQLKAALRWAKRVGLLREVPEIAMPKRVERPRGRPVTREELERMLDAVPKVVVIEPPARRRTKPRTEAQQRRLDARRAAIVASWRDLIEGLYLSGLRLEEALNLTWDDPAKIVAELGRRRPLFVIPPALQKSHKLDHTPIVPEFVEFLRRTPEAQRTGYVFSPLPLVPGRDERLGPQQVGRLIGLVGRKANVVVKAEPVKYASAHDLRRSFCDRWALKVMPQTLMKLARHASIVTTLTYYAGRNAETAADAVWEAWFRDAAVSDTSTDRRGVTARPAHETKTEANAEHGLP